MLVLSIINLLMPRCFVLYFILFQLSTKIAAQPTIPSAGFVFNDVIVPRIDVNIDPDTLAIILDNVSSNISYSADFYWDDGTKRDTVENVGLRLRGNTSRVSAKKSFKIEFTHFGGKKFHGLSDLNLNGEHNDPSISRAKIAWDIMVMAGIEAPRSNHVRLFINGEYRGLYLNVEHIDNDYLTKRNKDPDGQLFKCFYGVDFTFLGTNPNDYSRTVYEPQNNITEPDFYSLMLFTKALDDINNPNFRCNLEKVFDVDDYLKRMALEVLIGHWDNPIYNKNNAYLYHNPATGKYELLSYDIDNSLGIDWFDIDWSQRNIYSWAHPTSPRPIFNNLLKVPEYKRRYGYYISEYLTKFFNPVFLSPHIEKIKNSIKEYRGQDIYASYDYGYTYDDFITSFDKPTGAHVKNGIKEYITIRHNTAKNQLQNTVTTPIIEYSTITWTATNATIRFNINHTSTVVVKGYYKLGNGVWNSKILLDDGIAPDMVAQDGRYAMSFGYTDKPVASIYIEVSDALGKNARLPICSSFEVDLGYDPTPNIRINEFMADNTTIADNVGEFEDWIEIYNADASAIYLGDYFITDTRKTPNKWQLPSMDLNVGEFLLIWADEDQDQGDNHANFKLSKAGEFVGIYDSEFNSFAPIDTFSFESILLNTAYGLYPNGQGQIVKLSSPTPGVSNVLTDIEDQLTQKYSLIPNPAQDYITVANIKPGDQLVIRDAQSKIWLDKVIATTTDSQTDVSSLPHGLYFWHVINGGREFVLKFVKL